MIWGDSMDTPQEIGFEIRTLSNLIRRDFEKYRTQLNPDSPNGIHGWAIGYLINNSEKDIFQKDFENEFLIRRSTASNILKHMEDNGLIKRVPVDYDARLKKIILTDKAVEIHKQIAAVIKKRENKLRMGLSDDEIITFFKITSKLKKNLEDDYD